MAKSNRVEEVKLGKYNALGMVNETHPKAVIYIDPRQKPRQYLGTLIHEKIHHLEPDWNERKVLKWEKALTALLWANGYRKVK